MKHNRKNKFGIVILLSLFGSFNLFGQNPLPENINLEVLKTGFNFTEGPVWIEDLGLLFSDIPENKVFLWTEEGNLSEYINPSGNSNGLALDAEGNLILAQHGPRQVSRMGEDKVMTPIATHYKGKRLNSPNDVAIHSDGAVFFTDPLFGLWDQNGTQEVPFCGIYRISPKGDVQLLDSTFALPNGICFSPDESKLYANDSQKRDIYVWDVKNDSILENKQLFANLNINGYADGMKTDNDGNLFCTGPSGVWVFAPDGTFWGRIPMTGGPSNCNWQDEEKKVLFITKGNTVYKVDLHETTINTKKTLLNSKWPDPYPNPCSEVLYIPLSSGFNNSLRVDVFSITGQKIFTHSTGDSKLEYITLNTHSYAPGLYFVQGYFGETNLFSKRVMVE